jgi:type VI secretion system secreted protein VgrG
VPDDGVPRVFRVHRALLDAADDCGLHQVRGRAEVALRATESGEHQPYLPAPDDAADHRGGVAQPWLEGHQFAFRLRREYPKHLFRFQYKLDDLSYVRMLMQKAGIYSYIVETEHGDQACLPTTSTITSGTRT